jgi:hypothetical protein
MAPRNSSVGPQFVHLLNPLFLSLTQLVLSFEQIEEIIDAALPRAAQRASWWETLRSPREKMPQREACLEAGYVATRQADG